MANCLPFDSLYIDEKYDRVYKAEDWAWYFATFIANGVFPKPSDGLQVIAYNGMEVKVNAGQAFINGYAFRNPASKNIVLTTAEGALNRIDRVVVRWDLLQRDMYLTVLKGVPSARPEATAVTRTTEVWEIAIADIYVGKGVTKIQTRDITDQRFNSEICGIVRGTVEEIDASIITKQFDDFVSLYKGEKTQEFEAWAAGMKDFVNQYTNEEMKKFEKWVDGIKNVLKDTQNGELLIEVNRILSDMYQIATEADIDKIINDNYVEEQTGGGIFEVGTNEDIDKIISGKYKEPDETSENITDQA